MRQISLSPRTAFQIHLNKFGVTPDIHLSTFTDTATRRNVYKGFEFATNARLPRRTLIFARGLFSSGRRSGSS